MNILKTFAMFSVLLTAQTANAQFCGTILSNGQPEKELSIDPITTSQLKEMVTAVYRRIVEDSLGWGEFVGTQGPRGLTQFPPGIMSLASNQDRRLQVCLGPKPWESDSGWIRVDLFILGSDTALSPKRQRVEFQWKENLVELAIEGSVYMHTEMKREGSKFWVKSESDSQRVINVLLVCLSDIHATIDRWHLERSPR